MELRYLFIDFNSYFASVEQQLRPELRGKPVAVAPLMADTTCAIAASYEAKRFGVKTGTRIADAKMMCPGIHIVEARPPEYVKMHLKLVEAVGTCMPVEKIFSIDEMVCELHGRERKRENAEKLALHIKDTIARNVGEYMRSSIGIAPNQFLAKTASDMQKPDGLTIIEEKDLPHILYPLKPEDFTGIGRKMKKRLLKHSIYTAKDLLDADTETMIKIWGGIEGERMYRKLRGEVVQLPATRKTTVGHSHVLAPEFRNENSCFAVLHRLVQKAAFRLRNYGYMAGLMSVRVRFRDGNAWEDQMDCSYTYDTLRFLDMLGKMWQRKEKFSDVPFKVSVSFFKLANEEGVTEDLFEPRNNAHEALNKSLDKLNLKFGNSTVYYAGAHTARKSAPMRIAFTHIPDLRIESD